jgi:hypothetical protein
MSDTGFGNINGAYLAVRICCILVKGGGAAIMIIGERGDILFFDSSALRGFYLKGGELSDGKEVLYEAI